MKKVFSWLLVLMLLISLCGCNNKNTNPNPSETATTGSTETVETTEGTESTQGTVEETEASSPAPTQAPSNNKKPSATQPTQAPTTCSHTYKDATCTTPKTCTKCNATEGSASGHIWKDATCTAPKTCTKCNLTEGSVGSHNFVNGSCAVCNTPDCLNPKTSLKICGDSTEEYISQVYIPHDEYTLSARGVSFYNDGDGVYCVMLEAIFSSNPEDLDDYYTSREPVNYNNKQYYRIAAGMSPAEVNLTDTEINISHEGSTIKMILMRNGNLKVTSSTSSRYPVGLVMSTRWSHLQ